MYFNSLAYIFGFLPIVIIVYFALNKRKCIFAGKIWLVIASLVFYGWFNVKYVPLLLLYVLINFSICKLILKFSKEKNKSKSILIIGILFNLTVLLGFKNCQFFVDTINNVFKTEFPFVNFIMPLAVSFQTLQQIGFLADSYKNSELKVSLTDYVLFSVFFPQMIVGPIIKYNETIPQFNQLRRKIFNHKNFIIGLFVFLVGFYKKGFLVAPLNDTIIDKIPLLGSLSTLESWIFCIMEYFHAYLDFSSYIDMVIGSAMMLNIELPINFNSPMQAKNIADFWERWHITFARFMKDYVYEPLKKINPKDWFVDLSIMLTCFLGGLWQGVSICAVLWGFMHGLGFLIYRAWKKLNFKIPDFLSSIVTFLFVAVAGVFLRVQNIGQMSDITRNLFVYKGDVITDIQRFNVFDCSTESIWSTAAILICFVGILLTVCRFSIEGKDLARFVKPNLFWAFILAMAIVELLYFYAPPTGFLYYNF